MLLKRTWRKLGWGVCTGVQARGRVASKTGFFEPTGTGKWTGVHGAPGIMALYSAGSSFALELVESAAQPVASVAWYFDDEPVTGSSVSLKAGTHVVEAHLTLVSGATQILELTIEAQ